jgi:uncharacterized protein YeaO (DUF488 family)
MPFQVKRVYDSPQEDDGVRILVDRLWPRGLTKQAAAVDQWLRECAPSGDLRKWFGHDRERWEEFKQRYFAELRDKEALLAPVRALAADKQVTLLFAASDTECNNAVALMEYLNTKTPDKKPREKALPNGSVHGPVKKRHAAEDGR